MFCRLQACSGDRWLLFYFCRGQHCCCRRHPVLVLPSNTASVFRAISVRLVGRCVVLVRFYDVWPVMLFFFFVLCFCWRTLTAVSNSLIQLFRAPLRHEKVGASDDCDSVSLPRRIRDQWAIDCGVHANVTASLPPPPPSPVSDRWCNGYCIIISRVHSPPVETPPKTAFM